MGYFAKNEVREFFETSLKEIEQNPNTHTLMVPVEELADQFKEDTDILAIFWTVQEGSDENLNIRMEGKTFVRIEPDLYTDDRYAMDAFIAAQNNKTVGDVVRERAESQEEARKALDEKHPDSIANLFKKGLS